MWLRAGFGQDEAYLTVREILSEASTAADGMLWRERSGFGRWRFVSLGFIGNAARCHSTRFQAQGEFGKGEENDEGGVIPGLN